jgi:ParB/RepB/Spo0J family partition protein
VNLPNRVDEVLERAWGTDPSRRILRPQEEPMAQPQPEQAVPISRGELRVDPALNPRFIFRNLDALAGSLSRGQVEPLIVRRRKDGKGYDVGAGARRLKAAEQAKLPELLCIVRDLSDADMLAMSLAENDGREDLHPLEEGAAYLRFRDSWKELGLPGPMTPDQIASRCGAGRAHVIGRLRLAVDLGPKVREAFVAGRFAGTGRGVAVAMAFLAAGSKDRQDLALEEVIRSRGEGDKVDAELVRRVVKGRFLLRLADARFPLGDEKLVPAAGACGKCPKNSANQAELFEGAKIAGDALCTDPSCFAGKKQAHATLALEQARAESQEEVKPKEAKQAWSQAAIGPSSWVPADQPLVLDDKGRTLDVLLGRDKVARGYAVDDAGWFRSLVRRTDAVGGLRRAGHAEIAAKLEEYGKPKEPTKPPDEAGRAKVAAVMGELVRAAEHAHAKVQVARPVLLAIVSHLTEQALPETLVAVVRRRGLDDAGAKGSVRGRARAMVLGAAAGLEPGPLFALAVELVASHDALVELERKPKDREGRPFWSLLDAYAVDVLGKSARAKPAAPKAPKAAKKAAKTR